MADAVRPEPVAYPAAASSPRSRVRVLAAAALPPGPTLPALASLEPLPGYRAPLFSPVDELRPAVLPPDASPGLRAAAAIVVRQLAADGLWPTLTAILGELGPARFTTASVERLGELWAVGLPVDWLGQFEVAGVGDDESAAVVAAVARRLAAGEPAAVLGAELAIAAKLRFRPSAAGFRAASEAGEQPPRMVRLQIGGGIRDGGVVPGSALDAAGHLVAALPDADFLVAAPEEMLGALRLHALNRWPLRRPGQVLLLPAPAGLTAWAQDNGKAGTLAEAAGPVLATLAPRYASRESARAVFLPADSAVLRAVQASGHRVVPSPLLFQGGNLLVARVPQTGRRLLLLGAAEVARNQAIGLKLADIREAFRVEFGVDEVVVVPAVSYHLDLDVCLRVRDGKVVAFVNDPVAAARHIAASGMAVLRAAGGPPAAAPPPGWPAVGEVGVPAVVRAAVEFRRGPDGTFPGAFAQRFAADPHDSAEFQWHAFLLALDVLAAAGPEPASADGNERAVRGAWRQIFDGLAGQLAVFQGLGWQVVPVPSLPDSHLSLNYLNGLHTPTSYLMPVLGGRLAPLDAAAAEVFRTALGRAVTIVPIPTLDSQWHHGAVHCLLSAYPARP